MKHGHLIQTPAQPDVYTGPCYPEYIQQMDMKPAYVDIVAIVVDGGSSDGQKGDGKSIRMSVLNRHPSADWEGKIALPDFGESSRISDHRALKDTVADIQSQD
jgi:alpha-N-arabinofuranosidase